MTARRNLIDLTGKRFGRWHVIALHPERSRRGETRWVCRCDCGIERVVRSFRLRVGDTKSCGCLARERTKTKREMLCARVYWVWRSMKQRCFNPRHRAYRYYGGRGITVCDRWQSVQNFFADMGERPPGMSLDRINNDLGYFPENCRWATKAQQMANRRPWRHSKRRRKRSSSAALQRYVAATRRVRCAAASGEVAP